MSSDAYLCLGGTELVNKARSAAYIAAGWNSQGRVQACGSCGPEMAEALDAVNGAYSNPGTDKAPWFSTSEEHSIDFGGFLPLSIDGLGPGSITRELTQRASGRGSFLGPAIQESPTITVRGILFGRSCCAVEYGLRWLGTVLQGSCGSDCDGDDLEFLDCCPNWCEDSPGFTSYADCLAPHLRSLKRVQLVSSPRITNRYGATCSCCNSCPLLEVEFQLAAGSPCVYREPVEIASDQGFDLDNPSGCVEWVLVRDGDPCPDESCVEPDDCLVDPGCPPPPAPPAAPAVINPCVCDPMTTVRTCIDIEAGSIPEFTEGVPVVTINSGSREMRQVSVKFYLNNLGQDVDDLDPCNACGEVTLSRIPASSTFTFDGTTRRATILCPGSAETDATPLMGSTDGTLPVSWPEIQCADARFTVCITADAETVAADATVSLSIVPQECYG